MISKQRYDEDRIPTPTERLYIRGRLKGKRGRATFQTEWKAFMKEEQQLLKTCLKMQSQGNILPMTEEQVLTLVHNMMQTQGYTAIQAIRSLI